MKYGLHVSEEASNIQLLQQCRADQFACPTFRCTPGTLQLSQSSRDVHTITDH
jgi:hypothetical protein